MEVLTVFLSSTGKDLHEYREAVYEAIAGMEGYRCDYMENWGARDHGAAEFDAIRVKKCRLFVGIVGLCYGSCPKNSCRSFTAAEYDTAVECNRPRLMFLTPDDFDIRGDLIEPDDVRARQDAFRERVMQDRIKAAFRSPEKLALEVVTAIGNWEREQAEASTPPPPTIRDPWYEHPYPMPVHWTGRLSEMDDLTAWLTDDQPPVCCMVAMGGMGKSSLAWKWVKTRVETHEGRLGLRGIFQWSFYEGEVSFQLFLEKLCAYLSLSPEGDRVSAITQHLARHPVLLILDGFERLLRYYASVDAALLPEKARGSWRTTSASAPIPRLRASSAPSSRTRQPRHFLPPACHPRSLTASRDAGPWSWRA